MLVRGREIVVCSAAEAMARSMRCFIVRSGVRLKCAAGGFRPRASTFRAFRAPSGAHQLEDVVSHAHQRPFALHFPVTAQQKLPKAQRFLDLSEDRFGRRLSFPVFGSSSLGAQLAQHPILATQVFRDPPPGRRHLPPLGVLDPLRCHEGLDIVDFQQIDIRFLPVSRIGTDPLWGLLLLECDLLDQRYQLPLVRGRLTDLRDDDHLRVRIHRRLAVVGLDKGLVTGHHDAAVRRARSASTRSVMSLQVPTSSTGICRSSLITFNWS